MKQKIDLHTHSTASDGSYTPTELVHEAVKLGFSAIAITDHDTIDGLEEAEKAAEGTTLRVIRGCELSTQYNKFSVHVLGLFLPTEGSQPFNECLEFLQNARSERNLEMLEKLNAVLKEQGLLEQEITFEEVKSKSCGKNFGRGDFAAVLEDRKIVTKESKDAYTKYVGKGAPAYVARKSALPTLEAVKVLHGAQALVSLAHPVDSFTNKQGVFCFENLEKLVQEAQPLGLNALEAYHSKHSPEETEMVIKLAEKYGLTITGGSDFHGARKSNVKLGFAQGDVPIPAYVLEDILKIVE